MTSADTAHNRDGLVDELVWCGAQMSNVERMKLTAMCDGHCCGVVHADGTLEFGNLGAVIYCGLL